MKVCNDLQGSSTYGSDWLPLSTDGFVVTMTAADCDWPFLDDSGIAEHRFKKCDRSKQKTFRAKYDTVYEFQLFKEVPELNF
jgi:hypothetical protein